MNNLIAIRTKIHKKSTMTTKTLNQHTTKGKHEKQANPNATSRWKRVG